MKILRIVWGHLASPGLPALAETFGADSERASPRPGLRAWHLGARPSGLHHDLAAITIWDAVDDAVTAIGGDLASNRTLGRIATAAEFSSADFYEIEAARVRSTAGAPALIRVATGLLPPSAEADVQSQVRDRLATIDEEMVEGYVGRRFLGASVEIAFVSVWERIPSAMSLELPIWPDLASRKTNFLVRLFFAIDGGLDRADMNAVG